FLSTVDSIGGIEFSPVDIVLPLGISLFTFTQIAFVVDVYRGTTVGYNPIYYAAFVAYFPHLIAGPILRHNEIVPQFNRIQTHPLFENVAVGLTLIAIGLAKKVLIADHLAPYAPPLFDAAEQGVAPTLIAAWSG